MLFILALSFLIGSHLCALVNREIDIFRLFWSSRTADRHKQQLPTFHTATQLLSLIFILPDVSCCYSDCELSFSWSRFEKNSTFSCLLAHVARIDACSDTTVALAACLRTGIVASIYLHACRISFCVFNSCFLCTLRESGRLGRVFVLVLEFIEFARIFSFSVVIIDAGARS
jgi:hypothetical protein